MNNSIHDMVIFLFAAQAQSPTPALMKSDIERNSNKMNVLVSAPFMNNIALLFSGIQTQVQAVNEYLWSTI